MESPHDSAPLSGFRILVVEDAFLPAEDLARELSDLGCMVLGPEGYVETALKRIEGAELDGALLDVNLHDKPCFEIASALSSRHIPFIFLTGYDQDEVFPAEFRASPRLGKPIDYRKMQRMISEHFSRRSLGSRI